MPYARYVADATYRRKIARQPNKGGSLYLLRRSLLYAHESAIRHRSWPLRPAGPGYCRASDKILDKVAAYCRRISDSGH